MKIQIVSSALLSVMALSFLTPKASAESVSRMTCNPKTSSFDCLVCNCFHESRGEGLEGMVAVTKVVLAREDANSFPNSVCQVVYQKYQFSWTGDSGPNNIAPKKGETAEQVAEGIEECKKATRIAMNEGPEGVLYYFNPHKVSPRWSSKLKNCGRIGDHQFMVDPGNACPKSLGISNRKSGSSSSKGSTKSKGVK